MLSTKNDVGTIRTIGHVDALLHAAAERQRRPVAPSINVLVVAYARLHGLVT